MLNKIDEKVQSQIIRLHVYLYMKLKKIKHLITPTSSMLCFFYFSYKPQMMKYKELSCGVLQPWHEPGFPVGRLQGRMETKNNLFFRLWLQWRCLATRGQSPIENRNRFMFRRVEEKNKSCKTTSSTKKLKKTRDRPRVTTERKQSIKHNKQKRDTCKMTQKKTNDQKKGFNKIWK